MTRRDFNRASAAFLASRASGQILGPIISGGAPTSLPLTGNLILKLEASSLSGAQGAAISSWADTSGNGNNAVQSISTAQPVVNFSTLTGNKAAFLSGSSSQVLGAAYSTYFTLPSGVAVNTQNFTAIVVCENTLGDGANNLYFLNLGAANNCYFGYTAGFLRSGTAAITSAVPMPWGTQMYGLISGSGGRNLVYNNIIGATEAAIGANSLTGGFLGAFAANDVGNMGGNLCSCYIWNATLNQAQVTQAYRYLSRKYLTRTISTNTLLTVCGDSLSAGYASTTYAQPGMGWLQQFLQGNNLVTAYNLALSGTTTAQLVSPVALYSAAPSRKICVIWIGTNDNYFGPANTWISGSLSNLATAVSAARAAGYTTVVPNMLPRGGTIPNASFEANRQTWNATLVTNSGGIYGDFIVNIGADANIGQAGDNTNATYFDADLTHLNQFGNTYILANYFAPAIAAA